MNPNSSVTVRFACNTGHDPHQLCVEVRRGVPPELRCQPDQPTGINPGGGGGCPLPANYRELVENELRDNFQECKRRGFVLIHD